MKSETEATQAQGDAGGRSSRRRLLISSLYPMGGNYGGIMQAYALQRVLAGFGYEPYTINSDFRNSVIRRTGKRAIGRIKKLTSRGPSVGVPSRTELAKIQKAPREFVDQNLKTVDLFGMSNRERQAFLSSVSAAIVGSDQVWRGGYAHVEKQLFDYIRDPNLTRISYAASFGASQPIRYSKRLHRKAATLARRFTSLSVREDSGIEICRDYWGVGAECHVDPTMLLDAEVYRQLADVSRRSVDQRNGSLFSYILDQNVEVNAKVEEIAAATGLRVNDFFDNDSTGNSGGAGEVRSPVMKPVDEWLQGFVDARFVVTDSFHGSVFAIIFNKPFIAIANRNRGFARFDSLLRLFGLTDNLVERDSMLPDVTNLRVDWNHVNQVLQRERERSMAYLGSSLGVDFHR